MTRVGLAAFSFRIAGGVSVILSAAAYLFARYLFDGFATSSADGAAEVFNGWSILFGLIAIASGITAIAVPMRYLHRPHGWAFATFTTTMGFILVMFGYALSVIES